MDHQQGTDRNQIAMFCLESAIAGDSFVREVFRRFVCLLQAPVSGKWLCMNKFILSQ